MTTVKAVLSKERVKKSGGYALVIQVIHLRKKRVMRLEYDLLEASFDAKKECAVYNQEQPISRKQIKIINEKIKQVKADLKLRLEALKASGVDYTVADVMSRYCRDKDDIYLQVYLQKQINEKRRIEKIGIADAYQSTLLSIKRFLVNRKVTFDDVNVNFLRDYESYLISTGVVQNTVNYYMRNLRTIYNRAQEDGLVSNGGNPFRKYHMHNVKTAKRALKKNEIKRIASLDLSDQPFLEEARDFFLFSFFTRGMAPVDILYLRHTDIVDGVISYQRHKTQQLLQVTITDPLQKLLDKYKQDAEFVLPFINRFKRSSLREQYKVACAKINRELKKVAVLADIHTPFTTYVARHSWASIAKEDGASIAAISEGLGHFSEKTTLIYINTLDRTILDTINQKVVTL